MAADSQILKRRGRWFAAFTIISLCGCFIFAPLGGFFIWIFVGCTVYSAFYSVYNFILAAKEPTVYKKRKETEKEKELREYIRKHITILVSIMLGALLLVIIFWVFFA